MLNEPEVRGTVERSGMRRVFNYPVILINLPFVGGWTDPVVRYLSSRRSGCHPYRQGPIYLPIHRAKSYVVGICAWGR